MIHTTIIKCPYCGQCDLRKNGLRPTGIQNWHCCKCKKNFQLEYRYNARKPGVKEQIEELTLNSSGVRDIVRVLHVSKKTVINYLKQRRMPNLNTHFLLNCDDLKELEIDIVCEVEMDEFWSYVGSKENQRWTWYAMERKTGIILAWYNGRRQDDVFLLLFLLLSLFPIKCFYTDDWGAYSRHIPAENHKTGKDNTQKIERKNLNFRTHIKRLHRKTICFSKNEQIHDNVIGMYINRYYFKTGLYGNAA